MNFGLYNLYKSIDKNQFFKYAFIFCFVLVIVSKFGELQLNTLIGLIFAILVILFFIDKNKVENELSNNDLEEKKSKISNKTFEYLNTDNKLIDVLNNMELFSNFNKLNYEDCLIHMDNVIKIYNLVLDGTERYKYFYDLAKKEVDESLNCLSSLILSVPTDYYTLDSYSNSMKTMTYSDSLKKYTYEIHKILKSYLLKIHKTCKDRWNSEPVTYLSNPMDFDNGDAPFSNDLDTIDYSENYSLY